ncbi:hypothetical protein KKB18_10050 [bacterium]|nr:hypothetical protein [bacterium]
MKVTNIGFTARSLVNRVRATGYNLVELGKSIIKPGKYIMWVYVPRNSLNAVRDAMSKAGAGQISNYRGCGAVQPGEYRFTPVAGANPAVGQVGKMEITDDARLEVEISWDKLEDVIAAMKKTHPYEVPAFYVAKLVRHF